ncbi:MAG: hypothetical protein QOJ50_1794, partial [Cryptosporangiaceae bacterium]|nr:hypothetical protein [Cryptosporangiaceae bacterium]
MTRPGSPEASEPGDQPFDYLPYPARMRAWAQHARGLPEPDYRRLHARVADRHLALHLAVARRDGAAVERALADPAVRRRALAASIRLPVGDDPLVAVLWSGSAADRRALYGVLRWSGRVALAERLLTVVRERFGDPEARVLLAACSPSTVERWLPELGAQLGDLHRLARVAPAAVAAALPEPDPGARWSIRAWSRGYAGLLSVLARRDPDAAALAVIRSGLGYVGGPDLTRALLAHPGDHPLWFGATRLPRAARRIVRALPPAGAAALLVRCGSPHDRSTVLAALRPNARAEVLRLANPGGLTPEHAPELAELPDADRVPIVRELIADGPRWRRNTELTALLSWAEAAPFLWSAIEASSWKTRAAAWDRLLRRALREPDPRIFATVAAGSARAWHDQNAVRISALYVLAGAPRRNLARVPGGVFRQVTEAVLSARDSSTATVETALRCLSRAVDAGHDGTPLIARLLLAERAPARPDIAVPAGLWTAIRDRILREAATGRAEPALRIARIAPPVPELDALVGRWARSGNEEAAALWISAPATREARAGDLVAADPALGGSAAVWRIIATRRTDLVGAVLAASEHLPPVRPAVLRRWTPGQRAAYRARAERVALDEDAPLSARIAAVELVTRATVLTGLAESAPPPVAAAALTAYGHSPDAVPLLLRRAGEPTGVVSRAAVRALPVALGSLPAERITEVLARLLRIREGQVGAAKEAARLLGSLRPPGAVDALVAAWHGGLRHDVRAAVAVVLAGFADPRAEAVLAEAAVGQPAVRSAVARLRPESLAPGLRPAVGRAIAAALRSGDEDVRRAAAIAYR